MPLADTSALVSCAVVRAGRHVRPLRHSAHDATRGGHEHREGAQGRGRLRVPAEAAVQKVRPHHFEFFLRLSRAANDVNEEDA